MTNQEFLDAITALNRAVAKASKAGLCVNTAVSVEVLQPLVRSPS